MGKALIEGLLGELSPEQITAVDVRSEALESLRALGVQTSTNAIDAVKQQDLVILGLKPQVAAPVLQELAMHFSPKQTVVSVMAGVPTARIEELLPENVPVVRVMPQTLVRLKEAA